MIVISPARVTRIRILPQKGGLEPRGANWTVVSIIRAPVSIIAIQAHGFNSPFRVRLDRFAKERCFVVAFSTQLFHSLTAFLALRKDSVFAEFLPEREALRNVFSVFFGENSLAEIGIRAILLGKKSLNHPSAPRRNILLIIAWTPRRSRHTRNGAGADRGGEWTAQHDTRQ